jgi:hypothetical protein
MFELLETRLHYQTCLKNVSSTVKNRSKGNLTKKIDHFYWLSEFKYNGQRPAQNQIKKNDAHFNLLSKEKNRWYAIKYVNNIYVEFNCASNDYNIIFYFCKSIEH